MPSAKRGRPPIITPAVQATIIKNVTAIGTLGPAAVASGVSLSTLHRARKASEDFDTALKDAIEKFKFNLLLRIAGASAGNPDAGIAPDVSASKWLLERKFPGEYGKRNADALTTSQAVQFAVDVSNVVHKHASVKAIKAIDAELNLLIRGLTDGSRSVTE